MYEKTAIFTLLFFYDSRTTRMCMYNKDKREPKKEGCSHPSLVNTFTLVYTAINKIQRNEGAVRRSKHRGRRYIRIPPTYLATFSFALLCNNF
jgi:hypothetical protein